MEPENYYYDEKDLDFPQILQRVSTFNAEHQKRIRVIQNFRSPSSFGQNAYPQNFSIPKPTIRYICEKPSNPKCFKNVLGKLYFTCKFFYSTIRVIPLTSLNIYCQSYPPEISNCFFSKETQSKMIMFPIDEFYEIDFKFFFCAGTCFNLGYENSPFLLSFILTKFWFAEGGHFSLGHQILTIEEYKMLASIAASLCLSDVIVKDANGLPLPFEELFKLAPNLTDFTLQNANGYGYTEKTSQELATVIRSQKMKSFCLGNITPLIDPDHLITFVRNNLADEAYISFQLGWEAFGDDEEKFFKKVINNGFESLKHKHFQEATIY